MTKLKGLLIGLTSALNGLITGYPDEAFSAASYRLSQDGSIKWNLLQKVINLIFFWDYKDIGGVRLRHCELSYLAEFTRDDAPSVYFRKKVSEGAISSKDFGKK